ncbi:MAG: aspartate-semialdehyde dehydrogenase [Spirochaetes bacterium]|nr:aspartate-semialdehyde dehydrogenase [Spirochaetota bacterium]
MALKVTVVGVGLVGETIISCLKERRFPCEWPPRVAATTERPKVLAGEEMLVEETSAEVFRNADIVLFAGKEGAQGASATWREAAEKAGALCIDNGRDFRLASDVPLVVPEVNPGSISRDTRFIASPNCSTIQMVVALNPIHEAARIRRIIVAGFQSTSGWGEKGPKELRKQTPAALESLESVSFDPAVFPRPIAFNCIPQIEPFMEEDYTREELKLLYETRKIMRDDAIQVSATCVRVPVFVGHGQSIWIETQKEIAPGEIKDLLRKAGGVRLYENVHESDPAMAYPTSIDVHRHPDDVLVGRVRRDLSNPRGNTLWVVADNLRKGAALNVVQIAELLVQRGMV